MRFTTVAPFKRSIEPSMAPPMNCREPLPARPLVGGVRATQLGGRPDGMGALTGVAAGAAAGVAAGPRTGVTGGAVAAAGSIFVGLSPESPRLSGRLQAPSQMAAA